METYRTLWNNQEYVNKHYPGRGFRVRSGYAAFFKADEDCFYIRHCTDWYPEEIPPTIMKIYGNGQIAFHPHVSLRNDFKQITEQYLLGSFLDGASFDMYRGRKERGIRLTHKQTVITAGNVLFDNRGNIIQYDPPLRRIIDADLMTQYDALAKEVKKNAKLRVQLTALYTDAGAAWLSNAGEFYKAIQKASPQKLHTFAPLLGWAKYHHGGSHNKPRDGADALDRLFAAQRHKVLQHLGAVKYA